MLEKSAIPQGNHNLQTPGNHLDGERRGGLPSNVWREMKKSWKVYALLLPFLVALIVFMYYPPVLGLYRSFFQWSPGRSSVFVGFKNYLDYLSYPEMPREMSNMLNLLVFGWALGTAIPFLGAELIYSVKRAGWKDLYRLLLVIPMLAPGLVAILLWKYIYDPNLGPINALLDAAGLSLLKRNWLGDPNTAIYSVILMGFPWIAQFGTLIYLGGLAQISEAVHDSARIDGCTGLKRIFLIDLPLVLGQVRLQTIMSVIGAITAFDRILVLTNGGPGFATMVPAMDMYQSAFVSNQFGYAAAIGVLLFLFAMLLTIVTNRLIRPINEDVHR